MSNETGDSRKWRKRLTRWAITSLLMGVSFAAGVAITAFIAIRLLMPIAVTGMTMTAQAGAASVINALYSGDSGTRMTVLTYLKQSFDAQPTQAFDANTAAWLLPALERCSTDTDPKVSALAKELA